MQLRKNSILLPILYMAFIFVLSSISAGSDDKMMGVYIKPGLQNILHIPLYGILSILWLHFFRKKKLTAYSLKLKAVVYTLIICIAYGIFDEFHQYLIPGRSANIADCFFNIVGCFMGIAVYRFKSQYARHNDQNLS